MMDMMDILKFTVSEDGETTMLAGKSEVVELKRHAIQKLRKYPKLVTELLDAVSKGVMRHPFELTNLSFSGKGSHIQTFEFEKNILRIYERRHGSSAILTVFPIHGEEMFKTFEAFLEWLRQSV
jgi:hypothetical protein